MPAISVPASQVHDWLLHNIASALEYTAERTSSKENGPVSVSNHDVAMTDASTVSVKVSTSARGGNKAVIIPHSMRVLYFLHFMSWCSKYIKAIVNMGGAFLGVRKTIAALFLAEARDIVVARYISFLFKSTIQYLN
ncbi:putative transferase [Medicago truncatula]|uniref:Lecithin:cholesterol acyltransferase n=1 Tax=Medicago truncatula TaxID=3880 RepID=G7KK26_MEDTR|nr:lecithin:cholesterol acyltransferase [Medicago truncatula]RHN50931.1 putative transferase [Medicago truncatula]